MKNLSLKNLIPYFAAVALFIAISVGYFMPDIFQHKSLYQHDMMAGMGAGQEIKEYKEQTGEQSLWTNSMFGGMPTYQISPTSPSLGILKIMQGISWLFLPTPASYVFLLLFGAFLLFVSLRINPWIAILGAIAYAFSSYFFVIIQAGHIWKVWVLGYIPPTFAGIIWAYRGKYWIGAAVTAFYMALQLLSNHVQMTYYFGIIMLIFVIANFIHSVKNEQLSNFFKASAVLFLAVGIALALNLTNLYHTNDYSKYSTRGASELSSDQHNKTKDGLDRDYVTGWSYGIGETFSLLIPNVKGGSSYQYIGYKIVETPNGATLVPDPSKNQSALQAISNTDIREYIAQQSYYWGDQPSTSGPVYVGAFIMFLFVLGLFIVRGWFKWVLVIATALSIILAWGHNFMWFTNLFLDYFPLYSKFRSVSSILIIAELCIPILAILALKEIVTRPEILKEKRKELFISLGCTAGLILLFIIAPRVFFSFLSEQEAAGYGQMIRDPKNTVIYTQLVNDLESVRISIFRADAFRSLLFISVGAVLMLLLGAKKIKTNLFIVAVAALIILDMGLVNKRYLSSKDFKPTKPITSVIQQTNADKEILADKSLDYRVYNLTGGPFGDGATSFYHKSIGGYHGAKLSRYQDIIEKYLGNINRQNATTLMNTPAFNVLNMLNTKYIILPTQNGQQVVRNPNALGNAWFVDSIEWAKNADEEIAALAGLNPAKTAIIDKRFEGELKDYHPRSVQSIMKTIDGDSTNLSGNDAHFFDNSSITLTEYHPNKLVYHSNALTQKLAVFAEIYYPKGWQAYIDGKEVPHFRTDYILRAMVVPEGEHAIEFRFDPKTYHTTENIAWIAYILLAGIIVFAIIWSIRNKKEDEYEIMPDDKH